ncbi:MAG: O-antigen ligase family protein [Thermoleophilia bacterium]
MIRTWRPDARTAIWVGTAGALALAAVVTAASRRPDTMFLLMVALLGVAVMYLAWVHDPVWTFSGAMALTVFSGNWGYMGIPFGPDRGLFILGVLAILLRAPGARDRALLEVRPVHWFLVAALVWAIGSALFAGTLSDTVAVYALTDQLGLLPFAAFILGGLIFSSEHHRRIFLGAMVGTGAYLGVIALLETLGLTQLILPRYISNPDIGLHFGRARGPFLEAVAMGQALFACAVAAAIAFYVWENRRARIFAAAVVALCLLGTLFTLTRSIWLASAVSIIVTMAVTKQLRRFVIPTMVGGAVAVVAALVLIPGLSSSAEQRQNEESPIWDRYNTNAAALRMIDERPLVGFGWGTFQTASIERMWQAPDYPLINPGLRAHNVPLLFASELGLIGVTLWLMAFIAAVVATLFLRGPPEIEPWRIGLIAIAIHFAIVANFVPMSQAYPNMLVWLWAGLVYGACRPYTRRRASSAS